jgi:hypothetical protein
MGRGDFIPANREVMAWMPLRLSDSGAKPYKKVSRETFLSDQAENPYKTLYVLWR